jgi:hypothetical protein
MASDSVSERLRLLNKVLAEIKPQIKGLQNKVNNVISDGLRASLQERLDFLLILEREIENAISRQEGANDAYQALEDKGFPVIPDSDLPPEQVAELAKEDAADDAASAGFELEDTPVASTISINLGNPVNKP